MVVRMPDNSVVYLTTMIDAPAAGAAVLSCGSDDGIESSQRHRGNLLALFRHLAGGEGYPQLGVLRRQHEDAHAQGPHHEPFSSNSVARNTPRFEDLVTHAGGRIVRHTAQDSVDF